MKVSERAKARELRQKGFSYNEILSQVPVSKGTLSIWLKDVELTEDQKNNLSNRSRSQGFGNNGNQIAWEKKKEKLKFDYQPPLHDPLYTFGLALYWGEGTKYRSSVVLTNADPKLLCCFIKWIRLFFCDDFERFSVGIHHHRPKEDEEIKKYWSEQLNLSLDCFIKSSCSISKSSNLKRILPFGTSQVTVRGKEVWKIRQKIDKSLDIISGIRTLV